MRRIAPLFALCLLVAACGREAPEPAPAEDVETAAAEALEAPTMSYPEARREDHVDDYFGTEVADPYRWLEDLESEATKGFVTAQNALAQPALEAIPARQRILERMTDLYRFERFGVPEKHGGRYFFEANDGTNGEELWTSDGTEAGTVLVKDISRKIEDELTYPGKIKVTVIRESRFVDYAK